ncbi:hypothetical protein FA048_10820 [Pedobacter polaris]|uniref:Uncharacterized protein n=1 Tax=Pedobacter polaris TaxID=2571273 RepID=A0A4U1CRH0_9SPHI|nr:hypothetical protein [Pedobacter polaris]TKC10661.1 hypothetical protein FA048_10820 [Pedobacter polaris]
MKKFPFNHAGFQSLQQELYLLSDEVLINEAAQIEINFDQWMNEHFTLSEQQFRYLKTIDPRVKKLLTIYTSFAIGNRLSISLNKAEPSSDDDQGKIIWPKSTLTACYNSNNSYVVSGSLEINISYQRQYSNCLFQQQDDIYLSV